MSRVLVGPVIGFRSSLIALGVSGALLFEPSLAGSSAFADAKLRCDFDADGRTDLAIGVPGDNNGRGAVNVQYSPAGLLEVGAYFRRGLNLPGAAGSHQRVGASLACGDFDGDNFADLAIGVPGENLERGAVVVIYGSDTGLANKWNTYLTQDTIGLDIVAPAGAEDRFGETLAAGDFNGDGRDDLAIGVPGENGVVLNAAGMPMDYLDDVGVVHVVFGISSGLTGPAQSFSPLTAGACCVIAEEAHYGASLAVGDFDADGLEDLAIGAPLAAVSVDGEEQYHAGSVHILRGLTGVGLTLTGQRHLTEEQFSKSTKPRPFEFFGLALAAGQFDGLGGDDLAIGAPMEQFNNDLSPYFGYGAVYVAFFTGANLTVSGTATFDDQSPGGDGFGSSDRFGWSLVAGNFDGQHDDDLVDRDPGQRAGAQSDWWPERSGGRDLQRWHHALDEGRAVLLSRRFQARRANAAASGEGRVPLRRRSRGGRLSGRRCGGPVRGRARLDVGV